MAAVHVYSIHDHSGPFLAFNLRDILTALDALVERWTWWVGEFETADAVLTRSELAERWLSSTELTELAHRLPQMIAGTLIAFPIAVSAESVMPAERTLVGFPASRAELMIVAVDSTLFEVFAKDPEVCERLQRRFRDVRQQDPGLYF